MILCSEVGLAMRVPGPAEAPVPCVGGEPDGDLDRLARALANEDAVTAEAHVERLVTLAVQTRRLDDVVFWQRVMFKARLIRARRGVPPPPAGRAPGERPC